MPLKKIINRKQESNSFRKEQFHNIYTITPQNLDPNYRKQFLQNHSSNFPLRSYELKKQKQKQLRFMCC